ncbi:hypothetical protein C8R45DRAFT_1089246 [Mycena sanguinolenta]|nr:hypothetical protein C8R45DRAFT_1089246 [Mycena sanguinolenta]
MSLRRGDRSLLIIFPSLPIPAVSTRAARQALPSRLLHRLSPLAGCCHPPSASSNAAIDTSSRCIFLLSTALPNPDRFLECLIDEFSNPSLLALHLRPHLDSVLLLDDEGDTVVHGQQHPHEDTLDVSPPRHGRRWDGDEMGMRRIGRIEAFFVKRTDYMYLVKHLAQCLHLDSHPPCARARFASDAAGQPWTAAGICIHLLLALHGAVVTAQGVETPKGQAGAEMKIAQTPWKVCYAPRYAPQISRPLLGTNCGDLDKSERVLSLCYCSSNVLRSRLGTNNAVHGQLLLNCACPRRTRRNNGGSALPSFPFLGILSSSFSTIASFPILSLVSSLPSLRRARPADRSLHHPTWPSTPVVHGAFSALRRSLLMHSLNPDFHRRYIRTRAYFLGQDDTVVHAQRSTKSMRSTFSRRGIREEWTKLGMKTGWELHLGRVDEAPSPPNCTRHLDEYGRAALPPFSFLPFRSQAPPCRRLSALSSPSRIPSTVERYCLLHHQPRRQAAVDIPCSDYEHKDLQIRRAAHEKGHEKGHEYDHEHAPAHEHPH